MNKSKIMFIITLTILMLVGLTAIAATDIDNNDTTTITETNLVNTIDTTTDTSQINTINEDTTSTNEELSSQTESIQEISNSGETLNNKIGGKTQNLKASRTETATTYIQLNSYLTSSAYDTVTINIGNDIQLAGSTTVSSAIKTLTINGNNKVINGNNQHTFLNAYDTTVTVNNIILTGMYGNGGGGIRSSKNLTVINCTFINNTSLLKGIISSTNSCNIINCSFINNTKTNLGVVGGIIYSEGILTINNSYFKNNTKAIYLNNNKKTNIYNSNFTENRIAVYHDTKGTTYIENSTFLKNNSTGYGGAIWSYMGILHINNSNFVENKAEMGGALNFDSNKAIIDNCSFTNNNANKSGGAIYGHRNSTVIINNSNFTHNDANKSGGAIYSDSSNITLKNSNVTNNYVTSNTGYVIDFINANSVIITDNTFINNTDNVRDMLFSSKKTSAEVDIHGNSYIDNFLKDTVSKPNVAVVTDNEMRSYSYYMDLDLLEIYNDTVRNGTLNVYVNGILIDTTEVVNGRARIFFANNNLTKRENNIILEYITQSKHYQNTTVNFIVKKEINTTLTIQAPGQMIAGESAVINFTLKDVNNNPLCGEIIHVLVDEERVGTLTTDTNGFANYTFNARGGDIVRIEATHHTDSDSFYLSAMDVVADIYLNKLEPEIVIVPGNIIPHVEFNITIHLFDPDGNPIKNKTLIVNITEEGKPDITGTVTTDENGIGVFNFTPVDEGTLNVNVTSPSDDIYSYASESVQVSKNFITTNLIVTANSMKINQTNTISVEVLAGDGALISGTVELDMDGEIHTMNITNGRGTFHDYKSDTAGEKNVTAKFTSNIPGYANATKTVEFNVGKLPTRVTVEAVNRTAGNVTLKVLVFPEDNIGSIVNGGNIVIESVDGENRKVIYNDTLENGELIYLTDVNETGWYEFETEYHGNDYFDGEVNNTGSLEVVRANTNIITFDKIALVGDTITLNATVTDEDENPVNDGNVIFLLDGLQLYYDDGTPVEVMVENGIATTEYTLPETYTKGNYTITANYLGNNKYNTSSAEAKLSIELKETSISVTPLNTTKGNTTIEVTLNSTTDDNKPISDAEIIVKDEDGNIVGEGITDENGTAIITVDIPVGDNNITIIYPGDDTYNPYEETITVDVTPRESETTGTVANNTVGNVTIDVEVIDPETGEPVTGLVNIIIDDEIVATGDLDEEGKATIPVDIDKKGNYTIVIEYEGNDEYNRSIYTLDDTYIAGKDANVTVVVDNTTVGNTTVNVTITDSETDEPLPNATVIVTLPNGTNVTVTTDENGTVTIPIDVPSGDNNITITYPGGDDYEVQQENITVKVKSYSVVTVDAVEGAVLDNVTFTANVNDYLGNVVNGGYVVFKVGGKTLTYTNGTQIRTPVENGIAKLSYQAESGWIVDSHPNLLVEATYSGTSVVLSNRSDTSKVTIYKRNATVEVSAPDDYVNGTLHIDAVVHDQNGSLINDGVLVFKLNGLSVKDENNKGIIAQVVNGKVHLDVKLPFAYSAKKYNLTAVYSNKIYNKATGSNTTTLKAIPTYVNATVTIKDQFSKPVVTGQIYNQFNNAILEGTAIINIKFDGISYAKKVKVENGTFNQTLEGISIYKPGTHKVEVVAGANSHYDAIRETITTKATPKYNVNTEFINITRNKTTTRVQARIIDDKNKNVQRNLSITIKLNGKSFLVNKTVVNGNVDVVFDTSSLSNRNYNLELVSGANTYYNAGKATAELPKY